MQNKARKGAASVFLAAMMALSLVVGAVPTISATETQPIVHNVSNFGDWYWYYGRTDNSFFAESLDMSATTDWTYAQTAIGFGAAGGRELDGTIWNGSLATTIPSGASSAQRGNPSLHTWMYTKKTFELPADFDVDDIIDVSGIHRIDDALVILVNGVQVYRYNTNDNSKEVMSDTINWSAYTGRNSDACNRPFNINGDYDSHDTGFKGTSSPNELYDAASLTNLKSALRPGTNVITCVVGQRNSSSSDLWFDLQMSITTSTGETGGDPAPAPLAFADVVLSPGSNESQMMFTWYTAQPTGRLAFRIQGDDIFTEVTAGNTLRSGQYVHKATINGLLPSTTYEYRLIGENNTASGIYTFRTGNPNNFSFFAVGDPQIGSSGNVTNDTNGWKNTLSLATTNFPNASFLLSAGDQVETAGTAAQYTGYLASDLLKNLPIANAVGNHDSGNQLFADHFSIPNRYNVGTGATQFDYWFTYGNTLFMVLDAGTTSISGHKTFMENAIATNPDVTWTVVMFHQGPYVNASHRNDSYIAGFRSTWIPVFDELGIDVVLNGHDHSYVRSYQMMGNVAQTEQNWLNETKTAVQDPTGTLYVELNSGSGSKYYALTTEAFFVAKQNQANRPNFSVVDVAGNSLTITTYQVNTNNTLTEIDAYTIVKTGGIVDPEDPVELILATDKNIVRPDEYFNVSVSFPKEIDSNVVRLDFSFDADKFDFAGYTPADGATLLTREYGEGYVSVMVMLQGYAMEGLGSLMLKANPDVGISSSTITGAATFVERDENLDKAIKEANGSYIQKTNNAGTAGFVVDMIVLSNLIDAFGITSGDPDWDNYSHFDFNGNGMIDIFDIVTIAQMIK